MPQQQIQGNLGLAPAVQDEAPATKPVRAAAVQGQGPSIMWAGASMWVPVWEYMCSSVSR